MRIKNREQLVPQLTADTKSNAEEKLLAKTNLEKKLIELGFLGNKNSIFVTPGGKSIHLAIFCPSEHGRTSIYQSGSSDYTKETDARKFQNMTVTQIQQIWFSKDGKFIFIEHQVDANLHVEQLRVKNTELS